jgi:hypothetical protein
VTEIINRLAYPVMMLKCLRSQWQGVKLHLIYDIACLFDSHLKVVTHATVL